MAMTQISDVMDETLTRQMEELKNLKPGDAEFSKAEEAIAKLYKVRQEHYATDISDEEKMTEIDNDKAEAEAKIEIEKEKIKIEQDKIELERDRNKIEQDKIDLARDKDQNETSIEQAKIDIEKEKIKIEQDKLSLAANKDLNETAIERAKIDVEREKIKIEQDRIEVEKAKLDADTTKSKKERFISLLEIGTNVTCSLLHTVVEAGAIIVPIVFYNEWIKQGLEFEKDGTFTSQTFKGLIGKFRPTRK